MQDNKMNEEYTPTIITLVDEENTEHSFEIIDQFENNEEYYVAVVPYFEDPQKAFEEDPTIIFFRVGPEDEEGLETFDIVDDDEEYYEISGIFTKRYEAALEAEEAEEE